LKLAFIVFAVLIFRDDRLVPGSRLGPATSVHRHRSREAI
jgi:hypothetical protein